jgi:hypothetical protein
MQNGITELDTERGKENRDLMGRFLKKHTTNIGRKPSKETNKKISESLKGHNVSKETKRKISKILKGRKVPKEAIRRRVLSRQGYKHTKKTREKISEANKGNKNWLGKKHSKETKTKMSIVKKGRKFTEEHRKKLSKSLSGKTGKLSSNWKGGINPINDTIRKSLELRLWREAVFARDNWTCQKCEARGYKLRAHHILNFAQYPELRTAIDNGITFCDICHKNFHKTFGIKNNTKRQVKEWIGKME